ncbi:HNH endonuclease [Burkholderia pseudomallei]
MNARCNNPASKHYPRYGGQGVRVCDRWHSFENFLADMGERPPGMTLDRWPNPNGNYEPSNCRWATPKEQQNNRRNTPFYEFEGRRMSVSEWADHLGIPYNVLKNRFARSWAVERALTLPVRPRQGTTR